MVKGLFCFVLVVAFAAPATALPYRPGPQIVCAAPWTQLSTGCYRFHESPMTQSEAKNFCEEEQEVPARLVEINSAEENRAIIAEIKRSNFDSRKIEFWLGITDRNSEGDWVLESTGKSVVFTDWKSGEPNNKGSGENCAHINEFYTWNDQDCNHKEESSYMRTALCEKKSCAAPWTQLSTGCYRFHESQMTQSEAKKFCKEEQGVPAHLVEIDSVEEDRAIVAEMQRRNSFSQKFSWLGICQKNCAAPWTQLSTGCYRFHESPMTQSEAKKLCEEEQGVSARLVEINSAEENRAIVAEMQRQNSYSRKINFWLGINDRHSEGHWILESTNKSVVFTDWNSGEPNNAGRFGSENCAFINEQDKWNDVDCNGKPNNGWTRTAFCEIS